DAFVAKLSNDLKTLIQATYLGGSSWDPAYAIAFDSSATYLGGSGWGTTAYAIALDSFGNVYVAGETKSDNFPGTSGGAQQKHGGGFSDAFVAKLSNDLKTLIQATYLGGSGNDIAYAITLDSSGNVFVAGYTNSDDFPGTTNGAQPNRGGGRDAFVAKLSNDLKTLIQATYLGGSSWNEARAIAVDSSGNVFVAGYTYSYNFPGTFGGAQQTYGGGKDAFVAKLSNDLRTLIQATYLGGSYADEARAIALDSFGNVYVAGYTESDDFPGTFGGAQQKHGGGSSDAFVAKLSNDLKTLIQATYLGGSNGDIAWAIALDSSGNVYVAGLTYSYNFPGTSGGAQQKHGGDRDAFVAKLTGDLSGKWGFWQYLSYYLNFLLGVLFLLVVGLPFLIVLRVLGKLARR
ncbi:MAG: SBBP repeat-containing protein, partial [Alishewanella aestuarii]